MSSEGGSKEVGAEIQRRLAEIIASNLNTPVFMIELDKIDTLTEAIKQLLPKIGEKYSPQELQEEVSDFLSAIIIVRPQNEEEFEERFRRFLVTLEIQKQYEAVIILPGVIDLPVGTKLGSLEIIDPNTEDKELDKHLEFVREIKKTQTEGRSRGKVSFKAYTSRNVHNVLYKSLELPLAILSLIFDADLDVRDCVGIIRSPHISNIYFITPHNEIHGWVRYIPHIFSEQLERLSKIVLDGKPNKLKRKILQAIQVYGLARLSHKPEIRFLLLVSAFESLLLTDNDRDYLGKKLAEKTAFLLENGYEARLKIYKQMKNFYGKRSGLVHNGKMGILDSEVRALERLFQATAFRVLELSNDYPRMEQRQQESEKEGIEDYINKLKFS